MGKYKQNDAPTNQGADTPRSPTNSRRADAAPLAPHKDLFRELVELVVFIVVLVGLMQYFVAEAFVIPTGSLATTLLGDHKDVTCERCGHEFTVNSHQEVQSGPDGKKAEPVAGCECSNCGNADQSISDIPSRGGDMLLVAKYAYSLFPGHPSPLEVVVFKYPARPIYNVRQFSYIKRLIGMPGQTIAIDRGQIRVLDAEASAQLVGPDGKKLFTVEDSLAAWRPQYMYRKIGDDAQEFMEKHGQKFKILSKPPAQMLAMRRLVNDNNLQDTTVEGGVRICPIRWQPRSPWTANDADKPTVFQHETGKPGDDWLRYAHKLRSSTRQLITDFMSYNSGFKQGIVRNGQAQNWVGDLMLECEVKVSDPVGSFVLELSKGVDRFQARWDLTSGTCTLTQLTVVEGKEQGRKELASVKSDLKLNRTYRLRLANFDERLTVWVDNSLPFGDGAAYAPAREPGPTMNDLEPASIGASEAGVQVSSIKLFRNTYYTLFPNEGDSTAWNAVRQKWIERDEVMQKIRETPGWEWVPMDELRWRAGEKSLPPAVADLLLKLGTRQTEYETEWGKAYGNERDIFEEQRSGETEAEFKKRWAPLRNIQPMTLYVQPGHYLCLGDNSPASSDGREWGTVPERLLVGRAVLIYFPFDRFGRIR